MRIALVLLVAGAVLGRESGPFGRFLSFTDVHPDPYYVYGAAVEAACHAQTPKGGARAGYWGTPASDCDSPLSLVNATFAFIREHLPPFDFLIWTGDSVRHDLDSSHLPRSLEEIFQLNRLISSKVRDTVGKIPTVVSLGNNDVYPHNIMYPGPSAITTAFTDIWRKFIPERELHTFSRGGYYAVPASDALLLVSLNTMYFYDANKAVDGCPLPSKQQRNGNVPLDPGTEQLDWLEQQLIMAREANKQVWLTGHVPPNSYFQGCKSRYTELALRFQDTIVGQLFGHTNLDSFFWLTDSDTASLAPVLSPLTDLSSGPSLSSLFSSSSPYLPFGPKAARFNETLLSSFQSLPSPAKTKLEDYSLVYMSPSVIPTFFPTARVWEYNTTRVDWRKEHNLHLGPQDADVAPILRSLAPLSFLLQLLPSSLSDSFKKHKKKKNKRPAPPPPPRHSSPYSPSRSNTYLTPLGYTQYYLNLTRANLHLGYGPGLTGKRLLEERGKNGRREYPTWEVEYCTFSAEILARNLLDKPEEPLIPLELLPNRVRKTLESLRPPPESAARKAKEGKKDDLSKLMRSIRESGIVPYELPDLTLKEWVSLGRTLGKDKKAWKGYLERIAVSTGRESW